MFADRTNWRLAQNQLTEAVDAVRAGQTKLLDLTVSNPTRVGLEYDAAAILAALHSPQALDYDPQAKGLLAARQAVAAYYADQNGRAASDVSVLRRSDRAGNAARGRPAG